MRFKKEIWLYSEDGEYFNSDEYESKEAAIKMARKKGIKGCFYVGKKEDASIPIIHYTRPVLQDTKENIARNVFFKWIDDSGHDSNWYKIVDIDKINHNVGIIDE
ncbi:TPA: hypothetical protein ACG3QY_001650 [Clostridioides difficile]